MDLLDGKKVSQHVKEQLKSKVLKFQEKTGATPCLVVILVGEDPASQVYVRNKVKACEQVGFLSKEIVLPASTTSEELKKIIHQMNEDPKVHGLLVQLPLPKHLNESEILSEIRPDKDPDGLTVENLGLLLAGNPRSISCTPYGVMKILEYYKVPVEGKRAVVIGRSRMVGKPMALLLQAAGATVTVCHSKTRDMPEVTRQADLLVVAMGRPEFIGREFVKEGAVVIDVGIHRKEPVVEGGSKLCGDVKASEMVGWARALTPVPGGVGPMTIAMLLENTFQLACLQSVVEIPN